MEKLTLSGKQKSAILRSCDGKIRYKLSHLENLYVLSQDTSEEFSQKFNLNIDALDEAIRQGGWETLRLKYTEGDASALLAATREQLQELYQSEISQIELQTFQEKQQTEELLRHRARFGDLFYHDEITGDLRKDMFGQPIPLPLPNSSRRVAGKAKVIELLEGLSRLLAVLRDVGINGQPTKDPVQLSKQEKAQQALDEEVFGVKATE